VHPGPAADPPAPPDPGDCCGGGCARCVWDVYNDALEAWRASTAGHRPDAAEAGH
jgi:hypothetical protein